MNEIGEINMIFRTSYICISSVRDKQAVRMFAIWVYKSIDQCDIIHVWGYVSTKVFDIYALFGELPQLLDFLFVMLCQCTN